MTITLEIEADSLIDEIQQFASTQLIELRRQLTRNLTQHILSKTITLNPIETGRSRAAWATAMQQLGLTPPNGWDASSSNPTALTSGFSQGSSSQSETADAHSVSATNQVDYINFLEFGTSHQSPHAMVNRALLSAAAQLSSF